MFYVNSSIITTPLLEKWLRILELLPSSLKQAWTQGKTNKVWEIRIVRLVCLFCDGLSDVFAAEATLRQEEQKPGFSLQLLQITASTSYPYNTRLASALCFKNFIKRNWTDEDGNYKLQLDEVATIKRELISLMISVPAGIQSQLGEAVSVIADSDFWERWDTLVDVSSTIKYFFVVLYLY